MFKAIFLDFYGTLVHEDDEIIAKIAREISLNSPDNPAIKEISIYWWQCFSNSCKNSYGKSFRTQRELEQASIEDTLTHFKCENILAGMSDELFDYWQKPSIYEETISFLQQLTIPKCIVSNIDRADIEWAIKYHKISVQYIVTSEDVRSYKPRPEIFYKALEDMKCSPQEVLHIGDSLSSDVVGAQKVGIKSCWLNRKERQNRSEIKPDYEFISLLEILN